MWMGRFCVAIGPDDGRNEQTGRRRSGVFHWCVWCHYVGSCHGIGGAIQIVGEQWWSVDQCGQSNQRGHRGYGGGGHIWHMRGWQDGKCRCIHGNGCWFAHLSPSHPKSGRQPGGTGWSKGDKFPVSLYRQRPTHSGHTGGHIFPYGVQDRCGWFCIRYVSIRTQWGSREPFDKPSTSRAPCTRWAQFGLCVWAIGTAQGDKTEAMDKVCFRLWMAHGNWKCHMCGSRNSNEPLSWMIAFADYMWFSFPKRQTPRCLVDNQGWHNRWSNSEYMPCNGRVVNIIHQHQVRCRWTDTCVCVVQQRDSSRVCMGTPTHAMYTNKNNSDGPYGESAQLSMMKQTKYNNISVLELQIQQEYILIHRPTQPVNWQRWHSESLGTLSESKGNLHWFQSNGTRHCTVNFLFNALVEFFFDVLFGRFTAIEKQSSHVVFFPGH